MAIHLEKLFHKLGREKRNHCVDYLNIKMMKTKFCTSPGSIQKSQIK
jgi:hypothetical protein